MISNDHCPWDRNHIIIAHPYIKRDGQLDDGIRTVCARLQSTNVYRLPSKDYVTPHLASPIYDRIEGSSSQVLKNMAMTKPTLPPPKYLGFIDVHEFILVYPSQFHGIS